jgi:hypothetical protein
MASGTHIISRYEDVKFALRHPEIFSSDLMAVDIGQSRPLIPLQIDPPDHANYRRVMDPQLGPKAIEHLEASTRLLVNDIIDRFIERGECDVHAEFTVPLPCTVFLDVTGLPFDQLDQFLTWKDNIIRPGGGFMDMDEAAKLRKDTGAAMYAFFGDVIDERTTEPGDDIISRFIHAEIDGERMSRDEILDICYLFILGGLDTVTSRNTVHGSGTVNSACTSHSPRSMKRSMMSFTSRRVLASRCSMALGPSCGSITRRYLAWSGGSICSGINGRLCPMSTAMRSELKISGCRRANFTSS